MAAKKKAKGSEAHTFEEAMEDEKKGNHRKTFGGNTESVGDARRGGPRGARVRLARGEREQQTGGRRHHKKKERSPELSSAVLAKCVNILARCRLHRHRLFKIQLII